MIARSFKSILDAALTVGRLHGWRNATTTSWSCSARYAFFHVWMDLHESARNLFVFSLHLHWFAFALNLPSLLCLPTAMTVSPKCAYTAMIVSSTAMIVSSTAMIVSSTAMVVSSKCAYKCEIHGLWYTWCTKLDLLSLAYLTGWTRPCGTLQRSAHAVDHDLHICKASNRPVCKSKDWLPPRRESSGMHYLSDLWHYLSDLWLFSHRVCDSVHSHYADDTPWKCLLLCQSG